MFTNIEFIAYKQKSTHKLFLKEIYYPF